MAPPPRAPPPRPPPLQPAPRPPPLPLPQVLAILCCGLYISLCLERWFPNRSHAALGCLRRSRSLQAVDAQREGGSAGAGLRRLAAGAHPGEPADEGAPRRPLLHRGPQPRVHCCEPPVLARQPQERVAPPVLGRRRICPPRRRGQRRWRRRCRRIRAHRRQHAAEPSDGVGAGRGTEGRRAGERAAAARAGARGLPLSSACTSKSFAAVVHHCNAPQHPEQVHAGHARCETP
mmetsp:Transcript_6524/g.20994  ORF Transcript_6524/g.20994 Transcript_6524/m.20994 type:complete len:233 (+) Transcript_6524:667-1365(+)